MNVPQLVVGFGLAFLLLLGLFVARESWPDYQRRRQARNRPRRRGGYITSGMGEHWPRYVREMEEYGQDKRPWPGIYDRSGTWIKRPPGGYMAPSPGASAGAKARTGRRQATYMGSWPRLGGQSEAAATLAKRLGTNRTTAPSGSGASSEPPPGAPMTAADGMDNAA